MDGRPQLSLGYDPVECSAKGSLEVLMKVAMRCVALILAIGSMVGGFCVPAWGETSVLDAIRKRGHVVCGVSDHAPGFSEVSGSGTWSGLDVEFCSALAVAVLGNKDSVKFLSLMPSDKFNALRDNEIDVLMGATAWTLTRDTELGARFAATLYYDGQGFLVPRNHSISSVLELSGASICVLPGSTDDSAIADYFGVRKMRYQLITSDRWDELVKTYASGGCTVLTGDVSLLAYERSRLANGADHMLLPEYISKEPLGPAVKIGHDSWFAVVRWTFMALVAAEELGVNSSNVDMMKASPVHDIRRFLGLEADVGAPLGLSRDWAYQVVRQVGNYSEVFDRTLGQGSALKLDRGLNNLWTKGGLMYSAPMR
ncbi:amino acid ABC transporter substrate-binding protein [Hyphomicrobium denitrificans]|uniref:amino acid ABC transporter substrate-binding protein n=1 Tax=Hyphomicrobium denitrificans TaxID=53399 RepID=UPI00022E3F37|nr:amino acid ABC transporter substrate-binding protein [Hyphomicrobium denitrificans]